MIFRLAVAVLTVGKADILSQDMEGMLKVSQRERGGGGGGLEMGDVREKSPLVWYVPCTSQ